MGRPMPLKHATETRLVILLGSALVGVWLAVLVLSPFSRGAFLLGGLSLLSLLYPLLLLPLFRARRADYVFRMLHFLPFVLLLAWSAAPSLRGIGVPEPFLAWYTWEQGLLPLAFGFLFLFLYCFHVVRQRVVRSLALSTMLLLVVASSAYGRWSWDSLRGLLNVSLEAPLGSDVLSVNIDPSSSLGEEVWRMRLRRMHRRQERLLPDDGFVDRPSLPASSSLYASSSSTPPRLVSSGIEYRWILLLFLALYAGLLHERARRRVRL